MDLAQFGRHRKTFERSISECKLGADHRLPAEFCSRNLRKDSNNSYHQGTCTFLFALIIALSLISLVSHAFHFPRPSSDSSHYEMDCDRANDLRVNKSLAMNGTGPKIKEEELPLPPRRLVLSNNLNSSALISNRAISDTSVYFAKWISYRPKIFSITSSCIQMDLLF